MSNLIYPLLVCQPLSNFICTKSPQLPYNQSFLSQNYVHSLNILAHIQDFHYLCKRNHQTHCLMSPIRHLTFLLLCLFLTSCGYPTRYQEAKHVIAVADSLDQHEHLLYPDTAALQQSIRTLDNPFGRLFAHNQLGKAHYYIGRHLSLNNQITQAAAHYIAADRAQINDPIYRGRINSCMAHICKQNEYLFRRGS